jgi:hypothetical protein
MAAREYQLKITLSEEELARLDELRPSGVCCPAFFRQLLRELPRGDEVATREEALSILTSLARDGRVSAAIHLERALRATRRAGMSSTRSWGLNRGRCVKRRRSRENLTGTVWWAGLHRG